MDALIRGCALGSLPDGRQAGLHIPPRFIQGRLQPREVLRKRLRRLWVARLQLNLNVPLPLDKSKSNRAVIL
jgi:hypothetical protein